MDWYEEDVQKVEQEFSKLDYVPQMVFYGSSSVRLWDTLYNDFQKYKPVNLGFGGSTLEACVYFFQRILKPYFNTPYLIIYAGDNDLGDGKQPGDVLNFFNQLYAAIESSFREDVQVFFISIKPSIARWGIDDKIRETNKLIKESIEAKPAKIVYINTYDSMLDEAGRPSTDLYAEDGLHLSAKGYDVWKQLLQDYFLVNIDHQFTNQS